MSNLKSAFSSELMQYLQLLSSPAQSEPISKICEEKF